MPFVKIQTSKKADKYLRTQEGRRKLLKVYLGLDKESDFRFEGMDKKRETGLRKDPEGQKAALK